MLKMSVNLSTLMKALPHNEVDHQPGQSQTAHKLPLDAAQSILEPAIGHENPVTVETTLLTDSDARIILTSNTPRLAL